MGGDQLLGHLVQTLRPGDSGAERAGLTARDHGAGRNYDAAGGDELDRQVQSWGLRHRPAAALALPGPVLPTSLVIDLMDNCARRWWGRSPCKHWRRPPAAAA